MERIVLFLLFLATHLFCFAVDVSSYPNFLDHPYLEEGIHRSVAPYLLPLNHPIKPALDAVFSQARVIDNERTLLEAGFEIIAAMPGSFVIVARHPAVPGYVFKLYLDSEIRSKEGIPNYLWLIRRCVGAAKIRSLIQKKKIRYFKVPDKWLYLLPCHHPSLGPNYVPFVLIATDMQPEGEGVTRQAWKTKMSRSHLKELYAILKRGYGSKRVIENIPYTKRQNFAFTDTEYPVRKHRLSKVTHYLSEELQPYWEKLIQ